MFFNVSINVDVEILSSSSFVDKITAINERVGIDLSYLTIEFSKVESIYGDLLIDNILKIKLLGISISLDNFGGNISIFNRLNKLYLDEIKIDKGFVSNALVNEKSKNILMELIRSIKRNEINSVAEGVESYDLTRFLLKHECDEAQGYYYYMPRPANELPTIYLEQFNKRTSNFFSMVPDEEGYLIYDSFYESITNQLHSLKVVDIDEEDKINYLIHKIKGGLVSFGFSEGLVFLEKFNKSRNSKYIDDMLDFINYCMVLYNLKD